MKGGNWSNIALSVNSNFGGYHHGLVEQWLCAWIGISALASRFENLALVYQHSMSGISSCCFSAQSMKGLQFYIMTCEAIQGKSTKCRVKKLSRLHLDNMPAVFGLQCCRFGNEWWRRGRSRRTRWCLVSGLGKELDGVSALKWLDYRSRSGGDKCIVVLAKNLKW